jgi:hypothetical protein
VALDRGLARFWWLDTGCRRASGKCKLPLPCLRHRREGRRRHRARVGRGGGSGGGEYRLAEAGGEGVERGGAGGGAATTERASGPAVARDHQ